jgi:antitoxin PrlF
MDVTVSSKNQLTLPKAARERAGIKAGDRLRIFVRPDGGIVILPLGPITALKGIVPKGEKPLTIEEMNEAIAEGALQRYDRFIEDSKSE